MNPFRYRGYYYDSEIGLYYLQSRYYNPEWGRFLNADFAEVVSNENTLTDKNLYAYCDNNPVMRVDEDGEFWNVLAGAVVGASISLVSGIVSEVAEYLLTGDTEVDLVGMGISVALGAAEGALVALCPAFAPLISGAASASETLIDGLMSKDPISMGEMMVDVAWSGTIGAISGSGGGDFVRGGKLLNDAGNSIGNALKRGVNPKVKRTARKTVKKAFKQVCKSYVNGQIEDIAYGALSEFSAWYTNNVIW